MTPGTYRMQIYRGDSQRWQFRIWKDVNKTDPYDLTGATPKAQLRTPGPDGPVCAVLACVVTLPNIIDAALSAIDSAKVVNGAWDLQLAFASGDIATVLYGPVVTTADTSR